jgi:HlyD family secretion protein
MTASTPTTLRERLVRNRLKLAVYAAIGAAAMLAAWLILKPEPIAVEVSAVVSGEMQVTVDNQGQVRVHDKYVIAAPVAGELERIDLHEGDLVRKGQRVAILHPLPLDARQRAEALARLDGARALARAAALATERAGADQALAAAELQRTEKLVAQGFISLGALGFISPQAAERARASDATSRAELRAAQARELAAQSDIRNVQAALLADKRGEQRPLTLTAEVDGQVLRVHEKSGRTVASGTPLISLGDPSRYEVVVDVLSTDAVKIRPGAEMRLEQWGGGKALRAKVRTIEPEAFTKISALGIEEQRVNIVGDPVDALGALGDGYRADVRIVIWSARDAVIAPSSSLFRVGEEWRVFRVDDDGRARERKVAVGHRNANQAEILDGLKAGEKVVRFPSNALRDGARVVESAAR